MNKINLYIGFLFMVLGYGVQAQSTVSGTVTDSTGALVPNLSLYLQPKDSAIILAYDHTDHTGRYDITFKGKGSFELIAGGVFFEKTTIPLEVGTTGDIQLKRNIILIPKTLSLTEVVIEGDRPIEIKKDTVIFDAAAFMRGNEVVVEDLLKSIPGISVDSEGTVKVNGKEVEKIMVDGDDFFEKGYRVLTKNMPSESIDKVELLQNYSDNRLLKNVEDDEKVALNLSIKEDSKRIWFGNAQLGHDLVGENFYEIKANLMNFGNRNKYYFLTNFNNIGYDATGDVNHLIRPYSSGDDATIGDGQHATRILSNDTSPLNFSRKRTDFNNAELISLNAIFNPSKAFQIKALAFFNWDENTFYRRREERVELQNTFFENTEDYTLKNEKKFFLGKFDFKYDAKGLSILEGTTLINKGIYSSPSTLIFNSTETSEELNTENTLFDQTLKYTKKLKERRILLLSGKYKTETSPQEYQNNQFLFQDLFPNYPEATSVEQWSENKIMLAGIEAHLLDRKLNGDLLELRAGFLNTRNSLKSQFLIVGNDQNIGSPSEYQNNLLYTVGDLFLKSKYRFEIENIALIGKMDLHQIFNFAETNLESKKEQPFFLKPSLGFNWDLHPDHNITSFYSYNTSNADILDLHEGFILKDYRSLSKGFGDFEQLNSSEFYLNYQYGDWSDKFLANTFILFNKNHDFFSTNTHINKNYSLSESILIKDRHLLNITTNLDRYMNFMRSNLKVEVGYSLTNFKNVINSSLLREVNSATWNYGVELRSGFKTAFNFHIGSKWIHSNIKTTSSFSNKSNISFADLFLILDSGLQFQLKSERYHFQSSMQKNYYFVDLDAKYKLSKALSLSLTAKNLTNMDKFTSFSISDLGSSVIEYRLLPRHILLNIHYRF